MKKEPRSSYPIIRWGIRDVLVLLLIAIILVIASWIVQSKKVKNVVVDVKEKIGNETDYYKRKSKEKIGEVIMKKTGN